MTNRPFAVFDIDGTVIRWQLYHAVADELAHRGLLDRVNYEAVLAARFEWKVRQHVDSFKRYEAKLVSVVNQAMSGLAVSDVEKAMRAVLTIYKDQVYTYTRDLITSLKAKNYILFAISTSQIEIVDPIATYYGFDDYGGSQYEIKNGRFTGHRIVMQRRQKPILLKQLVTAHQARWKDSIAVGDSENDIPMLEIVDKPIAFNPTKQLLNHATKAAWPIVIERKNVVYSLRPDHGNYRLVTK